MEHSSVQGKAPDATILKVLLLGDAVTGGELTAHGMEYPGHVLKWTRLDNAADLRDSLEGDRWDAVVCAHSMPHLTCLYALEVVKSHDAWTPFLLTVAPCDEDFAVRAVQTGAADYIFSDRPGRLAAAIVRAVREAGEQRTHSREKEELQAAEDGLRKLSMAVRQSPSAVVIANPAGVIEYVNPKFTETTGFPPEETLGQNLRQLGLGGPAMEAHENLWRSVAGGGEWRGEFQNRRKDGAVYWERAYASPIRDASGAVTHYLVIKEEITQQKVLERQFQQSQKMEAIGQLAGGVAHDFNNILQVIAGYGNFLLELLPPEGEPREYAQEIVQGVERATGLTRQLLVFSSRQMLEMDDLDLNEVVGGMAKMLKRIIGEDIEMEFAGGEGLLAVRGDRGQMEQVLLNLCINARDAMPGGGTLTIGTENVVIDQKYCEMHTWAAPGNHVLLSVTDTGCGMDGQTQARIFDPFFTTKEPGEGTGLGLATVYGIVRQHQGMVQVYSEPGQGTSFKIYLPGIERRAQTPASPAAERARGGTETILVAEDDKFLRTLAARILESAGYTVLQAANGREALDLFSRHSGRIDLCLLDVVMPKLGGKGVYDFLRRGHPRLRFLFTSGYSANTVQTECAAKEGVDLIQKPYGPNALLRRVRGVLDAPLPASRSTHADPAPARWETNRALYS
ncbi:MAG: response regulator [Candidatus Hydrogenedens sp.]|nr:response regulator [Candidatus Hydrogenedens sp.]